MCVNVDRVFKLMKIDPWKVTTNSYYEAADLVDEFIDMGNGRDQAEQMAADKMEGRVELEDRYA